MLRLVWVNGIWGWTGHRLMGGKGSFRHGGVNKAMLKIDGREFTKAIGESDEFVSFAIKLNKGPFQLENMFYSQAGTAIMGATYIRVARNK